MTEDERQQASQLDTLTGAPLQKDILLHALPVCGPYSALQTCRFKLKLVPGSQKKGKAARQVGRAYNSEMAPLSLCLHVQMRLGISLPMPLCTSLSCCTSEVSGNRLTSGGACPPSQASLRVLPCERSCTCPKCCNENLFWAS